MEDFICRPECREHNTRKEFEDIIDAVMRFCKEKRVSLTTCGSLSRSPSWETWVVHADDDSVDVSERWVNSHLDRAEGDSWIVSVLVMDNSMVYASKLISFCFITGLLDVSMNRAIFSIPAQGLDISHLDELLDLGVGVFYDNADVFPKELPHEIPTSYFALSHDAREATLFNKIPHKGAGSLEKRYWGLRYEGPIPTAVSTDEVIIGQAAVLAAMYPIAVPGYAPFATMADANRNAFARLVGVMSCGHESAGPLSVNVKPKAIDVASIDSLISSFRLKPMFEQNETLAYSYEMAKRMHDVSMIWGSLMDEFCIRPSFPSHLNGNLVEENAFFFDKMARLSSFIGVESALDAYYAGVPLEDILA